MKEYAARIAAYMLKATREAKARTSWANPNAPYEEATGRFVNALLDDREGNAFLEDLRQAVKPVAWTGCLNGLSMAAVKLASPGVPDIYQGNETWDFSLVDPDNRRRVDYARREAMLAELEGLGAPLEAALAAMLASLEDGRAKLYVLWRMLQLRREREVLFRDGGYTAIRATGDLGRHLIAFGRRNEGESAIAVAPRLVATLGIRPRSVPCGAGVWADTRLDLRFLKEGMVLRDVFTLRTHAIANGGLDVASVLAHFPVAVLVAQ